MNKIRILYIIPDFSNCGPNNMCLNLIGQLDKKEYDIEVVALGNGEIRDFFSLSAKTYIFHRKDILGFYRYLKAKNFDIIHSHTIIGDIFSYFSFSKAIKITTIHNYPYIDSIYRRGKLIGYLLAKLQSIAIASMNKIACSESVERHCENKLQYKKLHKIENGIIPYTGSLPPLKNKEKIDFFYIGSLNSRKNVNYVLEAFSKWKDNIFCNFHVIGDGELYPQLKNKFECSNIIFYGKIPSPRDASIEFDCFVSASLAEGLPLALLESMSIGKAFICSDIEPHVEVEKKTLGAGLIFSLDINHEDLISKFDSYYHNQYKDEISNIMYNTFNEYYTSQKMAESYSKLYYSFIRGES
ncbi:MULTISPECIES: glycosyltransferase family 4 protein [Klebsiella pneumoniae complex]|uniref:glycosyltransferase family 4 protein n=1 Tax=Klebsiella pneumoniae complex TaxID=3390273 RepID=UPI00352A85EB